MGICIQVAQTTDAASQRKKERSATSFLRKPTLREQGRRGGTRERRREKQNRGRSGAECLLLAPLEEINRGDVDVDADAGLSDDWSGRRLHLHRTCQQENFFRLILIRARVN